MESVIMIEQLKAIVADIMQQITLAIEEEVGSSKIINRIFLT